jgi:hypothetical protein
MRKQNIFTFVFFIAFALFTHLAQAQTVYVTENGKKYHKKNCTLVNEGKKGIELSEAKKKGLEPCSVCKPETTVAPADKKKK